VEKPKATETAPLNTQIEKRVVTTYSATSKPYDVRQSSELTL